MILTDQGAGGQHVNTTDSAVRITHLPIKNCCSMSNERSQHKNKKLVSKMLKLSCTNMKLQKRRKSKRINNKTNIGWGHQIRSYVLQPYQLVKDLRNKVEEHKPKKCFRR